MKSLKKILFVLLILVAIVVVIGFFLPKETNIARTRTINAPIEMIFDQVNNLHNWDNWSPWNKIDTAMQVTYYNGGIGEGASYSWTSNNKSVGNGKLSISKSVAFDSILTNMDFGDQGVATANYYFEKTNNAVKVTWTFHNEMSNNLIERWMGVLFKPMVKKSYDEGLKNIESVCNELKKQDWYSVSVKNMPSMNYYGIMDELTLAEIPAKMGEYYSKLFTEGHKNGIKIIGAPFALYSTLGDTIKIECAIPVKDNSLKLKGIESKVLPQQKFAIIKYVGSYDNSEKPHVFMTEWLTNNKFEVAGSVMEIYVKGPMVEKDPNKYETYIMYPIK